MGYTYFEPVCTFAIYQFYKDIFISNGLSSNEMLTKC